MKGRDTYEFDSLRDDHIQLIRARELNRMKEATDYAGPPIAVRRRRRRRFNREVANLNLNATENRVGIVLQILTQMTDVFAFEKLLLRMIVGDLLTVIKVQYFACVGKYRFALTLKCQLQMSL